MKKHIVTTCVAVLVMSIACKDQQLMETNESDPVVRRSLCKAELNVDVETTTITKLVNPSDSTLLKRFELSTFTPTKEREEADICVREDGTWRMETRIKQPSGMSKPVHPQPPNGEPEVVKTVMDNNLVTDYDPAGNIISEMPWDQSLSNEMMFEFQEKLAGRTRTMESYIQDIQRTGGQVRNITPRMVELEFHDHVGRNIIEVIDLEIGVISARSYRETNGKLIYRTLYDHECVEDNKILKHTFTQYMRTLPSSGVETVMEITKIYYKYDYFAL